MFQGQQVRPDLTDTNQSNMQYSYPPQPVSPTRLAYNEHPPAGSELNSSLAAIPGTQRRAPSPYFAPNLLSMGPPDQNTSYAPQPGMLPGTSFVRNPGVQLSVSNSSFVSNPAMNLPVANPSSVHNPVRQLPILRPAVNPDSDPSFVRNSSVPTPAAYPSFFLSNRGTPSYFDPNSNMQPPEPNSGCSCSSCTCRRVMPSTGQPPVQPTATFQPNIISHPSYPIPTTSFSCPPPVSNWQHMPYSGPIPLHHPGNLNSSPPYQAGYFPAQNNYPPAQQANYNNQRPGYANILNPTPPYQAGYFPAQNYYTPTQRLGSVDIFNPTPYYVTYVNLYPAYTDSTTTSTRARNSYPSESNPNPLEQNSNPSGPNRTDRS